MLHLMLYIVPSYIILNCMSYIMPLYHSSVYKYMSYHISYITLHVMLGYVMSHRISCYMLRHVTYRVISSNMGANHKVKVCNIVDMKIIVLVMG